MKGPGLFFIKVPWYIIQIYIYIKNFTASHRRQHFDELMKNIRPEHLKNDASGSHFGVVCCLSSMDFTHIHPLRIGRESE